MTKPKLYVLCTPERLVTLDRPGDEGDVPHEAQPDRLRHPGSAPKVEPGRPEPAEARSRAEYYEALRVADGRPEQVRDPDQPATQQTGQSGWDTIETGNRPSLDALRVTPERAEHILDGEPEGGGGHRRGIGSPGKTEFPAGWDDQKIIDHTLDVARRPDSSPVHQDWNDRWLCVGTRDGVEVSVVVLRSGEIWTAWPEEGGPGVVRNPPKGSS